MKATGAVPYDMAAAMRSDLPRNLRSRTRVCIKAVDEQTGEAVGWTCWGFRGFAEEEVDALEPLRGSVDEREELGPVSASGSSSSEGQSGTTGELEKVLEESLVRLNALESEDMQRWMQILMPDGCRCIFVVGLYVAPAFQGRGVGSALLSWGTEVADRFGVYVWVHSSEAGWRAFSKHGFEVVGMLEVDLDEWAPKSPPAEEGEDANWGMYTFRYMKRLSE